MDERGTGACVGCGCGSQQPLTSTYFCRTCVSPVCLRCTTTSTASHYCPNCLDSMTSGDAALFASRCSKCFECPSCGVTLGTAHTPDGYAFVCPFCAWSSCALGLLHPKPDVLILDSVKATR